MSNWPVGQPFPPCTQDSDCSITNGAAPFCNKTAFSCVPSLTEPSGTRPTLPAETETSRGGVSDGNGISTGLIVGIAAGVVALILLVGLMLMLKHKGKWPFKKSGEPDWDAMAAAQEQQFQKRSAPAPLDMSSSTLVPVVPVAAKVYAGRPKSNVSSSRSSSVGMSQPAPIDPSLAQLYSRPESSISNVPAPVPLRPLQQQSGPPINRQSGMSLPTAPWSPSDNPTYSIYGHYTYDTIPRRPSGSENSQSSHRSGGSQGSNATTSSAPTYHPLPIGPQNPHGLRFWFEAFGRKYIGSMDENGAFRFEDQREFDDYYARLNAANSAVETEPIVNRSAENVSTVLNDSGMDIQPPISGTETVEPRSPAESETPTVGPEDSISCRGGDTVKTHVPPVLHEPAQHPQQQYSVTAGDYQPRPSMDDQNRMQLRAVMENAGWQGRKGV
ncbi:hypothetical protein HDU85_006038 [Gaertneriomyces sp. JEL0708]|nr:hypothetical protein HDU85_006038 [Gaertneriomyces sp. JEL0708]